MTLLTRVFAATPCYLLKLGGLLKKSQINKDVAVLSAGIVTPSPGASNSGGTALAPDLVKSLYDRYGIGSLVDGYAVHVYPSPLSEPIQEAKRTEALVERALGPFCSGKTASKPCWITEWRFKFSSNQCPSEDHERATRFARFMNLAACVTKSYPIRAMYVYDWEQSPTYGIFRCGRLLSSGKQLQPN